MMASSPIVEQHKMWEPHVMCKFVSATICKRAAKFDLSGQMLRCPGRNRGITCWCGLRLTHLQISSQNTSQVRHVGRYRREGRHTQLQNGRHDSLWFLWRACLAWGPVLLAQAIPPVLVRASAITVAVPSSVTAHHWGQVSRSNLKVFP